MKDVKIMKDIQESTRKRIEEVGNPALDAEGEAVMGVKRIAIDEPNTKVKYDPLR